MLLIGLGKMIKKVAQTVGSLLASKILGTVQHITIPGGSGYYTTTVGSVSDGYVAITGNGMGGYKAVTAYSLDGVTWTKNNSELFGNWFYSPTYGNGRYVAMSSSGQVAISLDGVNWTQNSSVLPGFNVKQALFRNGLFVSGYDYTDLMIYSSDGITWTNFTGVPGGMSNVWKKPVNDKFFAGFVGQTNGYVSDDLITWTASGSGGPVAYGNSLYAKTNGEQFSYSSDAINWTNTTNIYAPNYYTRFSNMVFANGIFIASSLNGKIAKSTDGMNWTVAANLNPAGDNYFFSYPLLTKDNKFFSFVAGTNSVLVSVDGETWTAHATQDQDMQYVTQPGGIDMIYPTIVNNKFMVISMLGNTYSSLDGINWIKGTSLGTENGYWPWSDPGFVPGQVSTLKQVQMAIGNQGSTGAEILIPTDVYVVPPLTNTTLTKITATNNSFSAITYDLAVLAEGVDLTDQNAVINDHPISAGATETITNITSTITSGTRVVALPSTVDSTEVKVYGTETQLPGFFALAYDLARKPKYSADGINWKDGITEISSASIEESASGYNTAIAYHSGVFVASGRHISSSTDGINWTRVITDAFITEIKYVGNKFVAYNNSPGVYHSSDGITWTFAQTPVPLQVKAVVYANGMYVLSATNNIFSTTDFITWNTKTMTPYIFDEIYESAIFGNGKFFVTAAEPYGNHGWYSTDGINWTQISQSVLARTFSLKNARAFYNNKFYIAATDIYGQSNYFYSEDLVTWTEVASPAGIKSFEVVNNKLFGICSSSNNLAVSSDGSTWNIISQMPMFVYKILYVNDKYYLFGGNSSFETVMVHSDDAQTWTYGADTPILPNVYRSFTARV